MKKATLLASLLILSCSSEDLSSDFVEAKPIVENTINDGEEGEEISEISEMPADSIESNTEKYGQLTFSSDLRRGETAKGPIPLCSENPPESIRYTLEDEIGEVSTYTSKVAIQRNQVFSTEPTDVLEGTYSVTDLTLLDANGEPTHKVPEITDEVFAKFTDRPTPFDIVIVADEESDAGSDIMCFTGEEVFTTIGGNTVSEIRVLNMYATPSTDGLDGCVIRITVDLYWKGQAEPELIYQVDAGESTGEWLTGRYSAPVPTEID
ncbi:MAG: hypothetical protein HKN31_04960, partial [Pricia sp.]|nr:hypothetical protein [Pricia sp.]